MRLLVGFEAAEAGASAVGSRSTVSAVAVSAFATSFSLPFFCLVVAAPLRFGVGFVAASDSTLACACEDSPADASMELEDAAGASLLGPAADVDATVSATDAESAAARERVVVDARLVLLGVSTALLAAGVAEGAFEDFAGVLVGTFLWVCVSAAGGCSGAFDIDSRRRSPALEGADICALLAAALLFAAIFS